MSIVVIGKTSLREARNMASSDFIFYVDDPITFNAIKKYNGRAKLIRGDTSLRRAVNICDFGLIFNERKSVAKRFMHAMQHAGKVVYIVRKKVIERVPPLLPVFSPKDDAQKIKKQKNITTKRKLSRKFSKVFLPA